MKNKKAQAITQITILLVGLFAFAFILGGMGEVSAMTDPSGTEKFLDYLEPWDLDYGMGQPEYIPPIDPITETPSWYTQAWEYKFGSEAGLSVGNIVGAAAAAYAGAQAFRWAAKSLGAGTDGRRALTALGAGAGATAYLYYANSALNILGLGAWTIPAIGAVIAIGTWLFTGEIIMQGYVEYDCKVWGPESGGENCELCNNQKIPCSEYQCRSLGEGCKYEQDQETGESICWWGSENDISPPIINADSLVLTEGYKYTPDSIIRAPNRGFKIEPETGDSCILPYEELTFGVYLDEPGKCKWDFVRTNSYDEMKNDFGGKTIKQYNHSQTLKMGELRQGVENNFSVYVKCSDMAQPKNENFNLYNFVFKFCVKEGPDRRPPTIESFNPLDGSVYPYGIENTSVDVWINRPGECRWSFNDKDYSEMENQAECSNSPDREGNVPCSVNLTGIENNKENKYYFRCQRTAEEEGENKTYTMQTSEVYTIFGSKEKLEIIEAKPNATVISSSSEVGRVTLEVKTFGGNQEGWAICSYKNLNSNNDYSVFENTESYLHSQDLRINSNGIYNYSIFCRDDAINSDIEEISFQLDLDKTEPLIARAYYEEGNMKIITNELSNCVFSKDDCIYSFEDGIHFSSTDRINHFTQWDANSNLYVKCQDDNGNSPANPTECSIELRAQDY